MQLPTVVPLVIPNDVLHQIKYLCKNIVKVEWSGILFYTLQGSIQNPKKLKITIKTILPLDMGTATFTSYNLDSRFMDFLEEDFEVRSQWKVGHIHSHNVMPVFFSGTDMDELHDNAPSHNFYLSLIVNNFMDFIAKIAFTGSAKQAIKDVPFIALDEKGKEYAIKKSDYKVEDTKLFIYDCEVKSSAEKIKVVEAFASQTAEIMKPKPIPVVAKQEWKQEELPWYKQPINSMLDKGGKTSNPFDFNGNSVPRKVQTPIDKDMEAFNKSFDQKSFNIEEEDEEEDYDERTFMLYQILKRCFNMDSSLTEDEVDDLALEEVVDTLLLANVGEFQIATVFMESYPIEFKKMFPENNAEDFIITTYDILELMETELEGFPELRLSVKLLNTMIEKFIQNERSTSKV